ncbi:Fungalysin/Thermolysin Extracellular metalloproteinase 5 [Rhizophlyctis rosea]|uniref:Extracellular metalloproteinase n=1 Tax=Rhizophlyctis rosea TaxID=64517 RepID=A0AAD5SMK2_9FUNG|nr:Fungalysin/Thermolysin Extracellular metalloproteinase 5 [Rhizophlyctis rosea]
MAPLRKVSLFGLVLGAAAVLSSAHPTASHGKSHDASVTARSHGNFGPDLPHQKFVHGVDIEAGLVTLLTSESKQRLEPVDAAVEYVAETLGLPQTSFSVSSSHRSKHSGVTHIYLQQLVDGVEVSNGVANVNLDNANRVISFGHSFHLGTNDSSERSGTQQPLVIANADADASIPQKHASPPSIRVNGFVNLASNAVPLGPVDALRSFARFIKIDDDLEELVAAPVHDFAPNGNTAPSFVVSGASFAENDVPAKLKYIQENGALKLVWDLEVGMEENHYNAFVDASTGKVLSLVDWVADASYNIYPLGTNDPTCGERVLVEDPAHPVASPLGWHSQGRKNFTTTSGNNVIAQENWEGKSNWRDNYRPDGSASLDFDYPVDYKKEPKTYVDAAVTNLFFWNNVIHDLFYVYGFDEESGNFQADNFGRGGKGGDAVVANAQDGSGYNNANFMTPRDGVQPRMRMYVWDTTHPMRDGDLEGGIVMHEYAHGISTRLTGGPMNVNCLGWGESGGMGEGWGDFFATITRMTANSTRDDVFGMGEYANGGEGIRKYKYSTSKAVNPSTYGFINRPGYWGVHAKGEVWAEILYEVYWNLVDKHGFDPDWFNSPSASSSSLGTYRDFRTGKHHRRSHRVSAAKSKHAGNIIALQLVVDGMKLQPCYPTFVDARDAILQADEVAFGGDNQCDIWRAFAKRGLGVDARKGGMEDFGLPKRCGGVDA